MAQLTEYIEELIEDVGPRPAGTQQEHQAAEIIAARMDGFGLDVGIEEFPCARNLGWVRILYYGLSMVGAAMMILSPGIRYIGAIGIVIGAVLMLLDHFGKNPLFSLFSNSLSQNVIAKYVPDGVQNDDRARKIVVLAHYDTTKTLVQAAPPTVSYYSLFRQLVRVTMIALIVFVGLLMVPFLPDIVVMIVKILAGITAIPVLLAFVMEIVNLFMPYNDGANCNGSGVGVLYGLALSLARGVDVSTSRGGSTGRGERRRSRDDGARRPRDGGGMSATDMGNTLRGGTGGGVSTVARDAGGNGSNGGALSTGAGVGGYNSMNTADLAGATMPGAATGSGMATMPGMAVAPGVDGLGAAGVAGAVGVASAVGAAGAAGAVGAVPGAEGNVAGKRQRRLITRNSTIGLANAGAAGHMSAAGSLRGVDLGATTGLNYADIANAAAAEAAFAQAHTGGGDKPAQAGPYNGAIVQQEFISENDLTNSAFVKPRGANAAQQTEQHELDSAISDRRARGTGMQDAESDKPAWFLKAKQNAEKRREEVDGGLGTDSGIRSRFADVPTDVDFLDRDNGALNERTIRSRTTNGGTQQAAADATVSADMATVQAQQIAAQNAVSQGAASQSTTQNTQQVKHSMALSTAAPEQFVQAQPLITSQRQDQPLGQPGLGQQLHGQPGQLQGQAGQQLEQPLEQTDATQQQLLQQQQAQVAAQVTAQAQAVAQAAQAAQAAQLAQAQAQSMGQMQSQAHGQDAGRYLASDQYLQDGQAAQMPGQPAQTPQNWQPVPLSKETDLSGLDREAYQIVPGDESQNEPILVPAQTPPVQAPDGRNASNQFEPGRLRLRNRLSKLSSLSPEASGNIPMHQANLEMAPIDKEELFADDNSMVSAVGAFVPLGTTGVMKPIGEELLQYTNQDEIYIDDAEDHSVEQKYSKKGDYSAPELVQIPRSRMKSFLGSVGGRLGGKKKEKLDGSPAEWLGVDERFNARKEGYDIGSWDNFNQTNGGAAGSDGWGDSDDDRGWSGGAFGGANMQENMGAMMRASQNLLDKEVWLVALGANESENVGVKSLFVNHGNELRNALFINVEGVGSGDLVFTLSEGDLQTLQTDHRMQNLIEDAAQNTAVPMGSLEFKEFKTDATEVLKRGGRAISILGLERNTPVAWKWSDDDMGRIKEDNLLDVVALLLEVIKSS